MLHTTWPCDECAVAPALEQLHYDLFDAIEKLSAARDYEFSDGYCALVQQIEQAFQKEEHWMEEMEFQSLKVHREQHARVLGALHHVNCRVMNGELALGREVVRDLLPQWFAFHRSTMDAALARRMQTMPAPASERASAVTEGERLESH